MSAYKLRPHHGLCLHFFRGEGYSAEFIANMTEISNKLAQNPMVQLVSDGDDLCRTCPNRTENNQCTSDEKVLRYDASVLALCNLTTEFPLPWSEFASHVQEHILDPNRLAEVCGECQWVTICSKLHAEELEHRQTHL